MPKQIRKALYSFQIPPKSRMVDVSDLKSHILSNMKNIARWRMSLDRALFLANYAKSIIESDDQIKSNDTNSRLKHNLILMSIIHYCTVFEKTKSLNKFYDQEQKDWHQILDRIRKKFAAHDEGLFSEIAIIANLDEHDNCIKLGTINKNDLIEIIHPGICDAIISLSRSADAYFVKELDEHIKMAAKEINDLPKSDREKMKKPILLKNLAVAPRQFLDNDT